MRCDLIDLIDPLKHLHNRLIREVSQGVHHKWLVKVNAHDVGAISLPSDRVHHILCLDAKNVVQFLRRKQKKTRMNIPFMRAPEKKPGGALLSRGRLPQYPRRWCA